MFTGIVEEVARIESVHPTGKGVTIRIAARTVLEGVSLGDSIAIDGACHTVTSFDEHGFTVDSIATTLGRTTLGEFEPGRRVNLERAMALGQRLGGHMVQGHVDGVGKVLAITPREELVLIDFTLPDEVAAVTILHGSITLDGISLTVNALPVPGAAQVSIIPFTLEHTNLADLRVGDRVNLEGDVIGKYVRQLLGPAPGAADLRGAWGYKGEM